MRILGVDPGLIATGYGVVEVDANFQLSCLAAGVIRPDSKELAPRLLQIHAQITAVLHEFIPDALALEDLYAKYEYPKTAILMGHARGAIYLASAQRAVPVISYAASEVKRAITGSGRAGKLQVQAMVQRLLRLAQTPEPDHLSDALALAICHGLRERGTSIPRW